LAFFKELISNFPKKIKQIIEGRDDLVNQQAIVSAENQGHTPLRKSIESLKSIPHCCHYLLLLS
jgi:hypothetical protein